MKIILFIVLLAAFAGCCPQRRLAASQVTDSVRIVKEVEYVERLRDTTIYVEIPAEAKEVVVKRDSSFLETSVALSAARILGDGSLFHSLENKARPVPVNVTVKDTSVRQKDEADSVRTERIEIPVRMPLRWYEKLFIWCGIVSAAIVLFLGAYKIIRIVFIAPS